MRNTKQNIADILGVRNELLGSLYLNSRRLDLTVQRGVEGHDRRGQVDLVMKSKRFQREADKQIAWKTDDNS